MRFSVGGWAVRQGLVVCRMELRRVGSALHVTTVAARIAVTQLLPSSQFCVTSVCILQGFALTAYRGGVSVKIRGCSVSRPSSLSPHMPMKPKVKTALLWVLLLPLAMAGCAVAPPIQEMSDARQAIKAAREADAEHHAAKSLQDAETSMQKATEELESGKYVEARKSAIAAKEEAIRARDSSVAAGQGK